MDVAPGQAVGKLVRDGLGRQGRPGIEKRLHRPGIGLGRRVRPQPVGVAGTGAVPGDVEEILRGNRKPGKRPAAGAFDPNLAMRDKRP